MLALIPAIGWTIGLALGVNPSPKAVNAGAIGLAASATVTWLLSLATLALLAIALWLIAPMYDAPRSAARAAAVAVHGALPVLIGGALLAVPGGALLTVIALALALYTLAIAVRAILPVSADETAECIAIALLILSGAAMLVGGVIAALPNF